MRLDKNGDELKVGDRVTIELTVTDFLPHGTKDEVVVLSNSSVSLACAANVVEKKYLVAKK